MGVEEKLKNPKEMVVTQSFLEPCYFRFRSDAFYGEQYRGIKKVKITFKDGEAKGEVVASPRRKYLKIFPEKTTFNLDSRALNNYLFKAFEKLILKNQDYTFPDPDNRFKIFKAKDFEHPLVFEFLELRLCYVNAKLIGGYRLTIKSENGEPFEKLEVPKYVKIRRSLQKLMLNSIDMEQFEDKLVKCIQKSFEKKASETLEFYGQA